MITVGKADVADAANMASVEKMYLDFPWTEAQIAEEIRSNSSVFVAAKVDGEYAGHLSGRLLDDECEFSNVVVAEKFRRRGVAQKMFAEFFSLAAARGVRDIFLQVRRTNEPALGLYKKIGFEPIGVRKGYYKGVDGIIMRKVLS